MATGSDQRSRDPEGVSLGEVRAWATLVVPFDRRWRYETSPVVTEHVTTEGSSLWERACATGSCARSALMGTFDRKCPLGCSLGRPRPMSSMATGTSPFTGYLSLLFSYNIIYFNNGFHLRCFRICCVVLQVVYHVRVAFLLYFQRSWRFLIPSSNFRVYSSS